MLRGIGYKPRRLLFVLGVVVSVGFFLLAWNRLVQEPIPWGETLRQVDWWQTALASALLFVAQGGRSLMGWAGSLSLGHRIRPTDSYVAWHSSQLAKYLPGGFWTFPARGVLYIRAGLPGRAASRMVAWETVTLLGTAALLGMFYVRRVVPTSLQVSAVVVAAAGAGIAFYVYVRRNARTGTNGGQESGRTWIFLLTLSAFGLATWFLIGVSFAVLVRSVGVDSLSVGSAIGIFCASWAAGFVVVIAPGGLGAREAALTFLLGALLSGGSAFVVAVLARGWWMLVEGLHFLGAALAGGMLGTRATAGEIPS